jgi:hypothetical protein
MVSDGTQSPYVTAKALVIASPLLLLLAVLPVLDRGTGSRPLVPWVLSPLLVLVLFLRVGGDDLRALRFSPVGPTDHSRQLIGFRPLIAGGPTLFLGSDEFIMWWMAGVEVRALALGPTPQVPLRPEKSWEFGQPADFDTVPASTLNEYKWFVAPRDAASSAPPPQLRLVRSTEAFQLWERVGRIRERSTLQEGQWPGAVLRCDTEEGRDILAGGGVAAVRRPPIVAPAGSAAAGGTVSVRLRLPAGTWELHAPYTSHFPVEVSAPGLRKVLPANLDRPGPRLPIGRVTVHRQRPLSLSFYVAGTALASPTAGATFDYVAATPAENVPQILPIARACGKYVDWYRAGPS